MVEEKQEGAYFAPPPPPDKIGLKYDSTTAGSSDDENEMDYLSESSAGEAY